MTPFYFCTDITGSPLREHFAIESIHMFQIDPKQNLDAGDAGRQKF
jgi:hypothetical protein